MLLYILLFLLFVTGDHSDDRFQPDTAIFKSDGSDVYAYIRGGQVLWPLKLDSYCFCNDGRIRLNTGFLDTNLTRTLPQWLLWGSCNNMHDLISILVISGSLSSAPTFQTHFNTVPSTSNLSWILVLLPLLLVVYQFNPPTSSNFNKILQFPIKLQ